MNSFCEWKKNAKIRRYCIEVPIATHRTVCSIGVLFFATMQVRTCGILRDSRIYVIVNLNLLSSEEKDLSTVCVCVWLNAFSMGSKIVLPSHKKDTIRMVRTIYRSYQNWLSIDMQQVFDCGIVVKFAMKCLFRSKCMKYAIIMKRKSALFSVRLASIP